MSGETKMLELLKNKGGNKELEAEIASEVQEVAKAALSGPLNQKSINLFKEQVDKGYVPEEEDWYIIREHATKVLYCPLYMMACENIKGCQLDLDLVSQMLVRDIDNGVLEDLHFMEKEYLSGLGVISKMHAVIQRAFGIFRLLYKNKKGENLGDYEVKEIFYKRFLSNSTIYINDEETKIKNLIISVADLHVLVDWFKLHNDIFAAEYTEKMESEVMALSKLLTGE